MWQQNKVTWSTAARTERSSRAHRPLGAERRRRREVWTPTATSDGQEVQTQDPGFNGEEMDLYRDASRSEEVHHTRQQQQQQQPVVSLYAAYVGVCVYVSVCVGLCVCVGVCV